MIRVMHLLCTNRFSGAESVAIHIINGSKTEGIYASLRGEIAATLLENNIEYIPLSKITVKILKKIIKEYSPDIIHAHDFKASVLTTLSTWNIPIISHIHHNAPWLKTYNFKSILYYLSCIKYKKILLVSGVIDKEYIFGKYINKKIDIISNPVDITKIRMLSKCEADVEVPVYDVIFLGRLDKPKNPFYFINIVNALVKHGIKVSAAIIGDGVYYDELKKRIKRLDLQESVFLLGFLKNPYKILSHAKVLCITSLWEGFGLAAVEALALGVPVVSTRAGGICNIVEERCGKICDSKVEYYKELSRLLLEPEYWRNKHLGAIAQAEKMDNCKQYLNRLDQIYESCIAEKR